MKKTSIYGKNIEQSAIDQFNEVMALDNVVQGALMPDAHTGYVLPIGGVVAVKGAIYPAFIGYDIGCGVLAYKTGYKSSQIREKANDIFNSIYRCVPCGEGKSMSKPIHWDYSSIPHTGVIDEIMGKGILQLGTLGGGNHFIEISHDENDDVWVVVHSGSRGVGHKLASHYMAIAKARQPVDTTVFEEMFDKKESMARLREIDIEKYEELKWAFVDSMVRKACSGNSEGTYSLSTDSKEWQDYITDMNFCLEFALKNRETMLRIVLREINHEVAGHNNFPEPSGFINRNHNHAELKDGLWIHRKGATHAEDGMMGVIPGNMRDGSFIVRGKGCTDSLCSSSHGGGRLMSRKKARESVTIDDFRNAMEWIVAKVDDETIDESPMAYKDIFEVMELQKDLVDVVSYLKPIINVKG